MRAEEGTRVSTATDEQQMSFAERLQREGVALTRASLDTVQINLGKLCNQACAHCHVGAGPTRTEIMNRATMQRALELVEQSGATTVDLTGGAPEMNPHFRWLLEKVDDGKRQVLVRCNLTVLLEPGMEDLPQLYARHKVEVVASLPCYTETNVDKQRGQGVYEKSIEALRRLNAAGYGQPRSGLVLTLVYNPGGPSLPGPQAALEADYKRELKQRFGLEFTRLLTITNAPIGRFAAALGEQRCQAYEALLANAFNEATLDKLMCRRMVSIGWDGAVYDCDFNQALETGVAGMEQFRLGQVAAADVVKQLLERKITVGQHCFACTAGAGSSCGGALQTKSPKGQDCCGN